MSDPDPEATNPKHAGGRPPRDRREDLATVKLYKSIASMLSNLAKWRKERLNKKDYSVADVVQELLAADIRSEWRSENYLTLTRYHDDHSIPQNLTGPVASGPRSARLSVPSIGEVSLCEKLLFYDAPQVFSLDGVLGQDGVFVVQVMNNYLADAHIISGDRLVIKPDEVGHNSNGMYLVMDRGSPKIKRVAPGYLEDAKTFDPYFRIDGDSPVSFSAVTDKIIGEVIAVIRRI